MELIVSLLAGSFLIAILSKLFNASIKQGSFYTVFKTAKVVPVFKSVSKQSLDNYRPMSLLCLFSKLLEKCLHDQPYQNFKIIIFFKYQFGFRENLSTEIASHQICKDFITRIENKHVTCSVFLNLRKHLIQLIMTSLLQNCSVMESEDYLDNKSIVKQQTSVFSNL